MAVVSTKELARTSEREVGRPAILKRRWVCVLDDNTTNNGAATELQVVAAALGITEEQAATHIFGIAHPSGLGWKLRKFSINEGFEGSPYHVEAFAEYGIVTANELLSPTSRDAVWSFEASSAEVPALFYYDGTTKTPLTNSAYDYFPGLTTEESIVRVSIQKNFASRPDAWFQANNSVNSATYLGVAPHTIKVAGVNATYKTEIFGGSEVSYWDATATLVYRQSGHNLQLPDIGFNFISGNEKRRAMVFDFQNGEWVASPNPVGLNGSGAQTGGAPAILNRRIFPEMNFQPVFGTPPT